ncbi:MAG: hypothetical protein KAT05_14345 [Spirochaetes bacterium]|nr:hypothetical protein [Spirochaetota bacterium]
MQGLIIIPLKLDLLLGCKNVLYHTKYKEFWKENLKLFTANDFIAELTAHIPPKLTAYTRAKRNICES